MRASIRLSCAFVKGTDDGLAAPLRCRRPAWTAAAVSSSRGLLLLLWRLSSVVSTRAVESRAGMVDRWERGIAAYASQFAIPEADVWDHLCALVGERMAEEAIVTAGAAWVDDCLSLRDRSLIVLAALIAQGGVEARLRPHVRWALEHGATPDELEALAALLAVYTGFPRASVGIEVIRDELARLDAAND